MATLMLETPLPGRPLEPVDFEALERRGIPREMAERAYLRRVESHEGAELVGRKNRGDMAGILYPYFAPGEHRMCAYRLRRDTPDRDAKGKELQKYLSPPGRGNRIYFLPGTTPEQLADTALPIAFAEGENKGIAQAVMAETIGKHMLSAAVSGVQNWRGTIGKETDAQGRPVWVKGPIPDLERIALGGRQSYICYDADTRTNWAVRSALQQFAEYQLGRGALVRLVELPLGGPKGINDFIGGARRRRRVGTLQPGAAGRPSRGGLCSDRPGQSERQPQGVIWLHRFVCLLEYGRVGSGQGRFAKSQAIDPGSFAHGPVSCSR